MLANVPHAAEKTNKSQPRQQQQYNAKAQELRLPWSCSVCWAPSLSLSLSLAFKTFKKKIPAIFFLYDDNVGLTPGGLTITTSACATPFFVSTDPKCQRRRLDPLKCSSK